MVPVTLEEEQIEGMASTGNPKEKKSPHHIFIKIPLGEGRVSD